MESKDFDWMAGNIILIKRYLTAKKTNYVSNIY